MGTVDPLDFGMRCQYCQKPISILRRLSDTEFCSAEHRHAYEAEQMELAMNRLREAAPASRKTSRRSGISAVEVPPAVVAATVAAARPDTMPGTAPEGFPMAGLSEMGPREAAAAAPGGELAGKCDPIPPPLGVMLAASLVGASTVVGRRGLPWATEVVLLVTPRPGRATALGRFEIFPGRPRPVMPRSGLAPEAMARPVVEPEVIPAPAGELLPVAGPAVRSVPAAVAVGELAPLGVTPVLAWPAGARAAGVAGCAEARAVEGAVVLTPTARRVDGRFVDPWGDARRESLVGALLRPGAGAPLGAAGLLREECDREAQSVARLADEALEACIAALPAAACRVATAPRAAAIAVEILGEASSLAPEPAVSGPAAGWQCPDPVTGVHGVAAAGEPLLALGRPAAAGLTASEVRGGASQEDAPPMAPVVPAWAGAAVRIREFAASGEALLPLPMTSPVCAFQVKKESVEAAPAAVTASMIRYASRPVRTSEPAGDAAAPGALLPLSLEPQRSREPEPERGGGPLTAARPALAEWGGEPLPVAAAAPEAQGMVAVAGPAAVVRTGAAETADEEIAWCALPVTVVPPAVPLAPARSGADLGALRAIEGPAAAVLAAAPVAVAPEAAALPITLTTPESGLRFAAAGGRPLRRMLPITDRMPMRRDCWRLAPASGWQRPEPKPARRGASLAPVTLADPRAFHMGSARSVRDLLERHSFRSARRFWRFAPADIKWLAMALPLLLAVWLWSSSSSVSRAAATPQQPAPIGVETAEKKPSVLEKSLSSFEGRIAQRSRVFFDEDFRSGLGLWTGEGNWARSWSYDKAGLLRPGRLAIYEPSVAMVDYSADLHAAFDHRALSWVFRAKDLKNYYAMRLTASGAGTNQRLSLERWTVKDGRITRRQALPVAQMLGTTTTLQVHMEIRGTTYTTMLQGQVIDVFTDATHASGGFGLFSNDGDQPRIYRMTLAYQDDFLGKLCSFLAPHPITTAGTSRP